MLISLLRDDFMQKALEFYDIYPKLVPADKTVTIHIRPLFEHVQFEEGAEYEVLYYPMERISPHGEYRYEMPKLAVAKNGMLVIEQLFSGEQEHMIIINDLEEKMEPLNVRIYSLKPDLFSKRPYKGDTHTHSYYSDGEESPGFIAASCRRVGFDFMAVTDHHQYEPSLEAQKCFAETATDLLICEGEEVHLPDNPVHIVNFGGKSSLNQFVRKNEEEYYHQVHRNEKELMHIQDKDARFQLASSKWGFEKIRQYGGLGVFCHPFWEVWTGYYVSRTVIDYMMANSLFDAVEILGGFYSHEEYANRLQVARYQEERAKGRNIAILGASDAHGCNINRLFGWFYTVVFAEELQTECLIANIKKFYSVAVANLPNEHERSYGPYRLVKYTQYLLREVFPLHDRLCNREGEQMFAHLAKDKRAEKQLLLMQGQTKSLYNKLWAKESEIV
ncbi:hypothetical protein IMX26_07325 [Clostridium sp. 'deep sea']|uniref:PHP domain-containing protein n=1 Tax=Clostridium sp. 'deep sea' TaxID=2779445 RepID=UPI0018968899|nr:hypothetical protein [Clostridium sp. 'deep sea']QOR36610.1 hypothetical protein IMX26_07325 [Clostridium sp. 'deep sea']